MDPSPDYKFGRATTEAFADVFGKLAEWTARYKTHCSRSSNPVDPDTISPDCTQRIGSTTACGSENCWTGQVCDLNNECVACFSDCSISVISDGRAVVPTKLAYRYYDSNERIFQKDTRPGFNDWVHLRNLDDPSKWGISCNPQDAGQQEYVNGQFISSTLLSYLYGDERVYKKNGVGIKGVIRNDMELLLMKRIVLATMKNMNNVTASVEEFNQAHYATAFEVLKYIDTNMPGTSRPIRGFIDGVKIFGVFFQNPGFFTFGHRPPGQCVAGGALVCRDDSPYICERTQGKTR